MSSMSSVRYRQHLLVHVQVQHDDQCNSPYSPYDGAYQVCSLVIKKVANGVSGRSRCSIACSKDIIACMSLI